MCIGVLESVQFYNVTDGINNCHYHIASQTTHGAVQAAHRHRPMRIEGIIDPTLYPLRKARMQLRPYRWPRSQTLPLGQLSGPQARANVRVAEPSPAGNSVSGQLSAGQADSRGDFQHQSRATTTKREVVKKPYGHRIGVLHIDPAPGVGSHRGEYALRILARGVGRYPGLGGRR